MRKIIILLLMLGLGFAVDSDAQQVSSAEYFINTDPGPGNGMAIPITVGGSIDESYSISTSNLPQGNHTLYVRTRGDDGLWSLAQPMPFYVQDTVQDIPQIETRSIVAAEYFINEDPGTGQGIAIPVEKLTGIEGTFSISTNGLAPGKHSVFVRTLDNKGLWSLALERQFAVMPSDLEYAIPYFTHDTVDAGVPMTFTNLSDSVDANTIYEWDIMNDGSVEYTDENITHTFDNTGIFQVKLTVSNDTLSTIYIGNVIVGDFENIMLTADGPLEICEGEMVTLTAPAGYSYEWNTGDTSQQIMVGATGTYYAWLTDANGLAVKSTSLSIDVTPEFNPVVDVQDAANGLSNGFAEVLLMQNIANLNIDNYNFQWSNGDTSNFVSDLAAGDYAVTVTQEACAHELDFTVGNTSINTDTTSATNIIAAEYFFNSDPGAGNGNALNVSYDEKISFQEPVSLDGLPAGNHKLYIRTKGNNGLWSLAQSMDIYIQDTSSNQVTDPDRYIVAAEYFVDTDPGVGNGTTIPVTSSTQMLTDQIEINATDYSSGEHTLYVRTLDDSGQWSIASSTPFQVCSTLPETPDINDQSICDGSSITLEASGTSGNTFRWFTGDYTLIENANGATYSTETLYDDATFFVAQVDANGCQSQLSQVNIEVQQLQIFAGLDETLSIAGPDYQLTSYFPIEGQWSGSNLSGTGLLTRNNLNENTFEMTYTVDSAGCAFADTKEITMLDLSQSFEITIEENPLQGLVLAQAGLSDIVAYDVLEGTAEAINVDEAGEITVADSTLFDYETQTVMNWNIEAMKNLQIYHALSLIVNLTDVNDGNSISELNGNTQISVYPNPSNDIFHIETEELFSGSKYLVYNVNGKTITTGNVPVTGKFQLEINGKGGLYLLKVFNDEQYRLIKLIKK